ncbi:hypothetical protein HYH02_003784 [Chlamydomonas schloesseri]|uniref:Uncharacterized protein n=1 Tax=Chlamydomonas schloesseri TaxID=2026947 RepID=A0A836B8U7_9CHLO|nr:hypothetical protein HYH02_003784 [Chlamydomonas schloesseri]|eukprot:KAG2451177.1 hypothetical protein HYH02_003784 [Chlamydomonas schloesseri]
MVPGDYRPGSYAASYLQQQAESAARRASSTERQRAHREEAWEEGRRPERQESGDALLADQAAEPLANQGSYAAIAAAAATAANAAAVPSTGSPGRAASARGPGTRSPSPSPPRAPWDPSVSRPATTVLAQATQMRMARLKRLAQRQAQLQQPPPARGGGFSRSTTTTTTVATALQPSGGMRASGARASASGRLGRSPVLLSAVVQQQPQLYDRQRLSAVERFIDVVDELPARYRDAQVLYLSKNSLTSVSGLEQFEGLRVLGLADNLLAEPGQVEALAAACPRLEALSLEGNPLAMVPHYRSRVLLALPGLKALDGRPVTEEERAAAPGELAAEEATVAVLMRNACEVHKMASVVQRAQLHMELLHTMYSRGAVMQRVEALEDAAASAALGGGGGGGGRSLTRLVAMWDYEGGLGAEERRKIRGALLREVGRMYRQSRAAQGGGRSQPPTWEDAFAQVMLAQQQTTAALLDLLAQCQMAQDELLQSMAATTTTTTTTTTTSWSAAGGGGQESGGGAGGEGAARARLLREAEDDAERRLALRMEREGAMADMRRAAAARPTLKSALKRTAHQRQSADGAAMEAAAARRSGSGAGGSQRSREEGDDEGAALMGEISDEEEGMLARRRRQSPSPPRWQSARSSPPPPEAVERLMRARRGVVASPARAGAAPAPRSRPAASGHTADASSGGTSASKAPHSARPAARQPLPWSAGPGLAASAAAGSTGGSRSGSADRARPWLRRRSNSVDAASRRRVGSSAGGTAAAGSSMAAAHASEGELADARRRAASVSPNKRMQSPPLNHPAAWRPPGAAPPGWSSPAASPSSSPDYKVAAQAVARAAQAHLSEEQVAAGIRSDAALAAAAAGGLADGSSPVRHSGQWADLPERGVSASPEVLGRRHGHGQTWQGGAHHARRSLQGALSGSAAPSGATSGSSAPSSAQAARRGASGPAGPDGRAAAALRASSPAAPLAASPGTGTGARARPAAGGNAAGAAASWAQIDDLRRQVEESAAETARLRRIADLAAQPIPVRAPLQPADLDTRTTAPLHTTWQLQADIAPVAAPSRPHPASDAGPPYAQLQPPPWALVPPPAHAWAAGISATPASAQAGAPTFSPQPQPQAPPPSLQPHRSASGRSLDTAAQHPELFAALPRIFAPPAGAPPGASWPQPQAQSQHHHRPPHEDVEVSFTTAFQAGVQAPARPAAQLRLQPPPAGPTAGFGQEAAQLASASQQSAAPPAQEYAQPSAPLLPAQLQSEYAAATVAATAAAPPAGAGGSAPGGIWTPQPQQPAQELQEPTSLGGVSVLRASLDVLTPGSVQTSVNLPSVSSTPSFSRRLGEAASGAAGAGVGGGSISDAYGQPPQPHGYAQPDAPIETPMQPQMMTGTWGVVDTAGPMPRDSVDFPRPPTATSILATPAFTLYAPPGGAGTGVDTTRRPGGEVSFMGPGGATSTPAVAAAATPGSTIVSFNDAAGGTARVEVAEMITEDSAGYKDQHIHLHIHPATSSQQAPDTGGTDTSTPQLFLQSSVHERRRGGRDTAAAPPTQPPALFGGDTSSAAGTLGAIAPPGSPLHESLASGKVVYEKIERIKPAGASQPLAVSGGRAARSGGEVRSGKRRGPIASRGATSAGQPQGGGREGGGREAVLGFGYAYDDTEEASQEESEERKVSSRRRGSGPVEEADDGYSGEEDHDQAAEDDEDVSEDEEDDVARDDGRRPRRSNSSSTSGRSGRAPERRRAGSRSPHPSHRAAGSSRSPAAGMRQRDQDAREQAQYADLQRQLAEQAALSSQLEQQLAQMQGLPATGITGSAPAPPTSSLEPGAATLTHSGQAQALQTVAAAASPLRGPLAAAMAAEPPTGAAAGDDRALQPSGSQRERTQLPSVRRPATSDMLPTFQLAPARDTTSAAAPTAAPEAPRSLQQHTTTSFQASPSRLGAGAAAAGPQQGAAEASGTPTKHAPSSPAPAGTTRQQSGQQLYSDAHQVQHQQPRPLEGSEDLPPALRSISDQIQAQAARNRGLQEQIRFLHAQVVAEPPAAGPPPQQVTDAAAAAPLNTQLPSATAAGAGLTASSTDPLPAGSLRALEQQLVSLTLEREALERALVGEQGEVRLLQQELGLMGQVADALEESQAQLQETRLAVAHLQQEVVERDQQLDAGRAREAELLQQLADAREELVTEARRLEAEAAAAAVRHQQQLEEARVDAAERLASHEAASVAALAAAQAESAAAAAAALEQHTAQMQELADAHAEELAALRSAHAEEVAALSAQHAEQVQRDAEAAAAALAQAEERRAAEAAVAAEAAAAAAEALQEAVRTGRERLEAAEAAHKAQVEAAAELHRRQLQEAEERRLMEVEEARREGEQREAATRAAAAAAAEALAAAHAAEVAALQDRIRYTAEDLAAARREGEERAAALQAKLEEALVALGNERMAHSELRSQHTALEQVAADTRRQLEQLHDRLEMEQRREGAAELLARRTLLRRALWHWYGNGQLCAEEARGLQRAAEHFRRRACRAALRRWHVVTLRTRLLRRMLHERQAKLQRLVLVSLRAQVQERRHQARSDSIAAAHHGMRLLGRCLSAWRRLWRAHAKAVSHHDEDAAAAAVTHHRHRVLRTAIAIWHRHVHEHCLPKTQKKRRAVAAHRRRLLRRGLEGFRQQLDRRAAKRNSTARSIRRRRFSLLGRALGSWLGFMEAARRKRSLVAAAGLQFGHSLVRGWHRAAARSAAIRRGVEAMQASSGTRRLRTCLARWRAFLICRRQSALAKRLAGEHRRGAVLWRCLSAWLVLAQQSAARQLQVKGMHEYQRMLQAAIRWQRMVELSRRQAAVVERAVRLFRHRVLAATQRAVLRGWLDLVEGRRALMRSAAVGFVQAFLVFRMRRLFAEWHMLARRGAVARGRAAAEELRGRLEASEASVRAAFARLEAAAADCDALQQQLREAQSDVLHLKQQLQETERQLAETCAALEQAKMGMQARDTDLAARAEQLAALQEERGLLQEKTHTLRQQIAAGEVSVASLHEQASSLQRSLAAAQAQSRELGLQMKQQAAQYEEQLLAARDATALVRREADSLAAAAARAEQAAADGEAQLRSMRSSHESLVASLRQELRTREAHILQLTQRVNSMPTGATGPALAAAGRPATALRPPSPLPSASPLIDRSLVSGLAARTAAAARALRPTGGLLSGRPGAGAGARLMAGLHDDPSSSIETAALSTTTAITQGQQHEEEEEAAQWRERERLLAAAIASRERAPLFEPSTAAAIAAAATAAAAAVRPPSPAAPLRSYEPHGRKALTAAVATGAAATRLLRTSLVSQPLLQPTTQGTPGAAPAADVWTRSPDPPASSSPQPDAHPRPVAHRRGPHVTCAAAATARGNDAAGVTGGPGRGGGDDDADDASSDSSGVLQSAALEEAVAAAAERLRRSAAEAQQAEQSRQVGEADFLRRRAGILQQNPEQQRQQVLEERPDTRVSAEAQSRPYEDPVVAPAAAESTRAPGSSFMPPERVVSLAGGMAPEVGAAAAPAHASASTPRAAGAPSTARASAAAAEMDRSLDLAAQQLQVLSAQQQAYQRQLLLKPPPPSPPSQPEVTAQLPRPQQQPRQQSLVPAVPGGLPAAAAGGGGVEAEALQPELPALTAGIVSTLSNLREAMRLGQPVAFDSSWASGGASNAGIGRAQQQQQQQQHSAIVATSTSSASSHGSGANVPVAEATLRELLSAAPHSGERTAAGGGSTSWRPPSAPSSQAPTNFSAAGGLGGGGGASPGVSGESGDSRSAGAGIAVPSLHSVPASYRAASPAGSTSAGHAAAVGEAFAAGSFTVAAAIQAQHAARASGTWLRRSADGAEALSSSLGSLSAGTAPAALGGSAGSASGAASALQQLQQLNTDHASQQQQHGHNLLPRHPQQGRGPGGQQYADVGAEAAGGRGGAGQPPAAGAAFPEQGHELYMLAGAHVAAAVVQRRLQGSDTEEAVGVQQMLMTAAGQQGLGVLAGDGVDGQGAGTGAFSGDDDDEEDEALYLTDGSPSSTARSMARGV